MAKEKAPHMPWYGREFYSDENVLIMTLEQEGAYLRLLWNCWQEGSIPSDTAKLAALCKNTPAKRFTRDIWPALSGLFSPDGDRLVHQKVELLRTAKEQRRAKWSEGARLANEKRWGSDRVVIGEQSPSDPLVAINKRVAQASMPIADCRLPIADCLKEKEQTLCSSDDERGAAPALELISPKPEIIDEVKAWFDAKFWHLYPRKVAKPQALKAARRHGKTLAARASILACLTGRLPAMQEQFRTDGDFRPYPASWLNMTPWLDPDETATKSETAEGRIVRALNKMYAKPKPFDVSTITGLNPSGLGADMRNAGDAPADVKEIGCGPQAV